MHLFRFLVPDGARLGLLLDGASYDLSSADGSFKSITSWLSLDDPLGAVRAAADKAREFPLDDVTYLAPLDHQEVWACGVTYLRSKVARMEESEGGGDFYDLVYEADRPELFFKSSARRVRGPGDSIRIRKDSTWDVPEPELCLVLSSRGEIVGYTVGNDVSSRSIEGENPLYLPQAKTYDGACAIGPMIALEKQEERAISMEILRFGPLDVKVSKEGKSDRTLRLMPRADARPIFEGKTSTAQMRRTPQELAGYLFRELTFPEGVFLLTGTGIVPGDDFTLQSGDFVQITIEGIGTLENFVE
jgi:2-dehydro-3-deoxy-D-arabinonate dehydratase